MDFTGIFIGAATFIIIGVFHPIVIKTEYYFGTQAWPAFLILGLGCAGAALFIDGVVPAAITGITGFSFLWSIKELFEQEERVKKDWFPANPRKSA
ncbi:DUF4491 family protein [Dehalogenimonas sp. THU2]|uniref:DUF4491 family protein n=1 Tax=Dehalogenimonas sp. THU2 TaxID=3151121 RepID=UPI003218883B